MLDLSGSWLGRVTDSRLWLKHFPKDNLGVKSNIEKAEARVEALGQLHGVEALIEVEAENLSTRLQLYLIYIKYNVNAL